MEKTTEKEKATVGRPAMPGREHRRHLGIRYNKYVIMLFDRIAARQNLTRTQALDNCIRRTILDGRIPDSYMPQIEEMIANLMKELDGDGGGKPTVVRTSDKKSIGTYRGSAKRPNSETHPA